MPPRGKRTWAAGARKCSLPAKPRRRRRAWIRRTLQGSLIGKRYVDAEERFELLCTKGGEGSLSLNGASLSVKQAKALPSSD